jgi:prevent-host-death family protein
MAISVRELKSRLSEYLRRVAGGEEVVVTSHGKEVARLVPPRRRRASTTTEAELINRFRGLPWVRASSGEKVPLPKPIARIGRKEKSLSELVSELRE